MLTDTHITDAVETTYACGHVEIEGGNIADPSAVFAEMAGRKTFVKSESLCSVCLNPVWFPEIVEWTR